MENDVQVSTKIIEIIRLNLNIAEDQEIGALTPLADIISGSVEFIQIIVDIEDEFDIEFGNEELSFQSFSCVGDLMEKTKYIIDNANHRGQNGTGSV